MDCLNEQLATDKTNPNEQGDVENKMILTVWSVLFDQQHIFKIFDPHLRHQR